MGNCAVTQHAVTSWADDGEWDVPSVAAEEDEAGGAAGAAAGTSGWNKDPAAAEVTIRIPRKQLQELMEKRAAAQLLADVMNAGHVHVYHHCKSFLPLRNSQHSGLLEWNSEHVLSQNETAMDVPFAILKPGFSKRGRPAETVSWPVSLTTLPLAFASTPVYEAAGLIVAPGSPAAEEGAGTVLPPVVVPPLMYAS